MSLTRPGQVSLMKLWDDLCVAQIEDGAQNVQVNACKTRTLQVLIDLKVGHIISEWPNRKGTMTDRHSLTTDQAARGILGPQWRAKASRSAIPPQGLICVCVCVLSLPTGLSLSVVMTLQHLSVIVLLRLTQQSNSLATWSYRRQIKCHSPITLYHFLQAFLSVL